jgi:hypothetical protein
VRDFTAFLGSSFARLSERLALRICRVKIKICNRNRATVHRSATSILLVASLLSKALTCHGWVITMFLFLFEETQKALTARLGTLQCLANRQIQDLIQNTVMPANIGKPAENAIRKPDTFVAWLTHIEAN